MPTVDLIDETFLVAHPTEVARRLHDPALWRAWWPRLELTVFMDRGDAGLRWTVTGDVVGSSEVWLEPHGDGVILHYFLRADLTERGSTLVPVAGGPRRVARRAQRLGRRYAIGFKRSAWAFKDELEGARQPGLPREPAG